MHWPFGSKMVKEKGWFDDHSDDEKIEVTILLHCEDA